MKPIAVVILPIVSFFLGCLFIYVTHVRSLHRVLDKREEQLNNLHELVEKEQRRVAEMGQISQSELKEWIAGNMEINTKFSQIQRRLHQAELEMRTPGLIYLSLGLVIAAFTVGLWYALMHSANAEAASTLDNVAILAPEDMVKTCLVASASRQRLANAQARAVLENHTGQERSALSPGTRENDGNDD